MQYYVNALATRCMCRGFSYRGRCAHLKAVLALQRAELTTEQEVLMG